MNTTNVNRWIGVGPLGLPLYGALTFFSSLNPQPDPNTHLEAWSRFVTTDSYVLKHVFLSIFGVVFAIFGTFALGAFLARSRAGRLGLVAMVVTVLGSTLFLTWGGVTAFAAPEEGQAVLAGLEENEALPTIFANTMQLATMVVSILPPTVPAGAVLLVIGGSWMARSVLRRPSTETMGVGAQPRVQ